MGQSLGYLNDSTQGLILFSQINRQGSLSAAAQLLGMSRSSVSKQLSVKILNLKFLGL